MNIPTDVLLSDKFAEFSGKITALHERKKEIKDEFRKAHEQYKAAIAAIDEEAKELQDSFTTNEENSEEKED